MGCGWVDVITMTDVIVLSLSSEMLLVWCLTFNF